MTQTVPMNFKKQYRPCTHDKLHKNFNTKKIKNILT